MHEMLTVKRITSQTDLIKKCYLKVGNFHKVSGIRISELNTKKKKKSPNKKEAQN